MSTEQVKVSIIIPPLNRREFLISAVQSVLNQSHKNIQIVIHDNNSSDGTPEAVTPFLQDKRVEYHRVDHDLTMTENWSMAFRYVQGEYFVRLDDDNVFYRDFVESALYEMKRLDLSTMTFFPLNIQ